MLDEKGLVAALKTAFKGGGYKAAFVEGKLLLRCGVWAVEMDEEYLMPKVLGVVTEHIGIVPGIPAAYFCQKKMDPGSGVSLDEELDAWVALREMFEAAATPIRRTRLLMDGYEIWQTGEGLRARPMDPDFTRIIDEEGIKMAFVRIEDGAPSKDIYFKGFAERAVICGVTYENNPGLARIEGFPWLGEGS